MNRKYIVLDSVKKEELLDWDILAQDVGKSVRQMVVDVLWNPVFFGLKYLEEMDPDPWAAGQAEFELQWIEDRLTLVLAVDEELVRDEDSDSVVV